MLYAPVKSSTALTATIVMSKKVSKKKKKNKEKQKNENIIKQGKPRNPRKPRESS